jgi:hypothetical protein
VVHTPKSTAAAMRRDATAAEGRTNREAVRTTRGKVPVSSTHHTSHNRTQLSDADLLCSHHRRMTSMSLAHSSPASARFRSVRSVVSFLAPLPRSCQPLVNGTHGAALLRSTSHCSSCRLSPHRTSACAAAAAASLDSRSARQSKASRRTRQDAAGRSDHNSATCQRKSTGQ